MGSMFSRRISGNGFWGEPTFLPCITLDLPLSNGCAVPRNLIRSRIAEGAVYYSKQRDGRDTNTSLISSDTNRRLTTATSCSAPYDQLFGARKLRCPLWGDGGGLRNFIPRTPCYLCCADDYVSAGLVLGKRVLWPTRRPCLDAVGGACFITGANLALLYRDIRYRQ